jgi:hypothetical protein
VCTIGGDSTASDYKTFSLYLNGTLAAKTGPVDIGASVYDSLIPYLANTQYVGPYSVGQTPSTYPQGALTDYDNIALYSRALTAPEVAALFMVDTDGPVVPSPTFKPTTCLGTQCSSGNTWRTDGFNVRVTFPLPVDDVGFFWAPVPTSDAVVAAATNPLSSGMLVSMLVNRSYVPSVTTASQLATAAARVGALACFLGLANASAWNSTTCWVDTVEWFGAPVGTASWIGTNNRTTAVSACVANATCVGIVRNGTSYGIVTSASGPGLWTPSDSYSASPVICSRPAYAACGLRATSTAFPDSTTGNFRLEPIVGKFAPTMALVKINGLCATTYLQGWNDTALGTTFSSIVPGVRFSVQCSSRLPGARFIVYPGCASNITASTDTSVAYRMDSGIDTAVRSDLAQKRFRVVVTPTRPLTLANGTQVTVPVTYLNGTNVSLAVLVSVDCSNSVTWPSYVIDCTRDQVLSKCGQYATGCRATCVYSSTITNETAPYQCTPDLTTCQCPMAYDSVSASVGGQPCGTNSRPCTQTEYDAALCNTPPGTCRVQCSSAYGCIPTLATCFTDANISLTAACTTQEALEQCGPDFLPTSTKLGYLNISSGGTMVQNLLLETLTLQSSVDAALARCTAIPACKWVQAATPGSYSLFADDYYLPAAVGSASAPAVVYAKEYCVFKGGFPGQYGDGLLVLPNGTNLTTISAAIVMCRTMSNCSGAFSNATGRYYLTYGFGVPSNVSAASTTVRSWVRGPCNNCTVQRVHIGFGQYQTLTGTYQCTCPLGRPDLVTLEYSGYARGSYLDYALATPLRKGCACADTNVSTCSTACMPCTDTQTTLFCGNGTPSQPLTTFYRLSGVQTDSRCVYCPYQTPVLQPNSCPGQFLLRACTPDEVRVHCPYSFQSGCMMRCDLGSVDCKRWGQCSETRACTPVEVRSLCGLVNPASESDPYSVRYGIFTSTTDDIPLTPAGVLNPAYVTSTPKLAYALSPTTNISVYSGPFNDTQSYNQAGPYYTSLNQTLAACNVNPDCRAIVLIAGVYYQRYAGYPVTLAGATAWFKPACVYSGPMYNTTAYNVAGPAYSTLEAAALACNNNTDCHAITYTGGVYSQRFANYGAPLVGDTTWLKPACADNTVASSCTATTKQTAAGLFVHASACMYNCPAGRYGDGCKYSSAANTTCAVDVAKSTCGFVNQVAGCVVDGDGHTICTCASGFGATQAGQCRGAIRTADASDLVAYVGDYSASATIVCDGNGPVKVGNVSIIAPVPMTVFDYESLSLVGKGTFSQSLAVWNGVFWDTTITTDLVPATGSNGELLAVRDGTVMKVGPSQGRVWCLPTMPAAPSFSVSFWWSEQIVGESGPKVILSSETRPNNTMFAVLVETSPVTGFQRITARFFGDGLTEPGNCSGCDLPTGSGAWRHTAITADASTRTLSIYRNGVLTASASILASVPTDVNYIFQGCIFLQGISDVTGLSSPSVSACAAICMGAGATQLLITATACRCGSESTSGITTIGAGYLCPAVYDSAFNRIGNNSVVAVYALQRRAWFGGRYCIGAYPTITPGVNATSVNQSATGYLDDLAIYSEALDAGRVAAVYGAERYGSRSLLYNPTRETCTPTTYTCAPNGDVNLTTKLVCGSNVARVRITTTTPASVSTSAYRSARTLSAAGAVGDVTVHIRTRRGWVLYTEPVSPVASQGHTRRGGGGPELEVFISINTSNTAALDLLLSRCGNQSVSADIDIPRASDGTLLFAQSKLYTLQYDATCTCATGSYTVRAATGSALGGTGPCIYDYYAGDCTKAQFDSLPWDAIQSTCPQPFICKLECRVDNSSVTHCTRLIKQPCVDTYFDNALCSPATALQKCPRQTLSETVDKAIGWSCHGRCKFEPYEVSPQIQSCDPSTITQCTTSNPDAFQSPWNQASNPLCVKSTDTSAIYYDVVPCALASVTDPVRACGAGAIGCSMRCTKPLCDDSSRRYCYAPDTCTCTTNINGTTVTSPYLCGNQSATLQTAVDNCGPFVQSAVQVNCDATNRNCQIQCVCLPGTGRALPEQTATSTLTPRACTAYYQPCDGPVNATIECQRAPGATAVQRLSTYSTCAFVCTTAGNCKLDPSTCVISALEQYDKIALVGPGGLPQIVTATPEVTAIRDTACICPFAVLDASGRTKLNDDHCLVACPPTYVPPDPTSMICKPSEFNTFAADVIRPGSQYECSYLCGTQKCSIRAVSHPDHSKNGTVCPPNLLCYAGYNDNITTPVATCKLAVQMTPRVLAPGDIQPQCTCASGCEGCENRLPTDPCPGRTWADVGANCVSLPGVSTGLCPVGTQECILNQIPVAEYTALCSNASFINGTGAGNWVGTTLADYQAMCPQSTTLRPAIHAVSCGTRALASTLPDPFTGTIRVGSLVLNSLQPCSLTLAQSACGQMATGCMQRNGIADLSTCTCLPQARKVDPATSIIPGETCVAPGSSRSCTADEVNRFCGTFRLKSCTMRAQAVRSTYVSRLDNLFYKTSIRSRCTKWSVPATMFGAIATAWRLVQPLRNISKFMCPLHPGQTTDQWWLLSTYAGASSTDMGANVFADTVGHQEMARVGGPMDALSAVTTGVFVGRRIVNSLDPSVPPQVVRTFRDVPDAMTIMGTVCMPDPTCGGLSWSTTAGSDGLITYTVYGRGSVSWDTNPPDAATTLLNPTVISDPSLMRYDHNMQFTPYLEGPWLIAPWEFSRVMDNTNDPKRAGWTRIHEILGITREDYVSTARFVDPTGIWNLSFTSDASPASKDQGIVEKRLLRITYLDRLQKWCMSRTDCCGVSFLDPQNLMRKDPTLSPAQCPAAYIQDAVFQPGLIGYPCRAQVQRPHPAKHRDRILVANVHNLPTFHGGCNRYLQGVDPTTIAYNQLQHRSIERRYMAKVRLRPFGSTSPAVFNAGTWSLADLKTVTTDVDPDWFTKKDPGGLSTWLNGIMERGDLFSSISSADLASAGLSGLFKDWYFDRNGKPSPFHTCVTQEPQESPQIINDILSDGATQVGTSLYLFPECSCYKDGGIDSITDSSRSTIAGVYGPSYFARMDSYATSLVRLASQVRCDGYAVVRAANTAQGYFNGLCPLSSDGRICSGVTTCSRGSSCPYSTTLQNALDTVLAKGATDYNYTMFVDLVRPSQFLFNGPTATPQFFLPVWLARSGFLTQMGAPLAELRGSAFDTVGAAAVGQAATDFLTTIPFVYRGSDFGGNANLYTHTGPTWTDWGMSCSLSTVNVTWSPAHVTMPLKDVPAAALDNAAIPYGFVGANNEITKNYTVNMPIQDFFAKTPVFATVLGPANNSCGFLDPPVGIYGIPPFLGLNLTTTAPGNTDCIGFWYAGCINADDDSTSNPNFTDVTQRTYLEWIVGHAYLRGQQRLFNGLSTGGCLTCRSFVHNDPWYTSQFSSLAISTALAQDCAASKVASASVLNILTFGIVAVYTPPCSGSCSACPPGRTGHNCSLHAYYGVDWANATVRTRTYGIAHAGTPCQSRRVGTVDQPLVRDCGAIDTSGRVGCVHGNYNWLANSTTGACVCDPGWSRPFDRVNEGGGWVLTESDWLTASAWTQDYGPTDIPAVNPYWMCIIPFSSDTTAASSSCRPTDVAPRERDCFYRLPGCKLCNDAGTCIPGKGCACYGSRYGKLCDRNITDLCSGQLQDTPKLPVSVAGGPFPCSNHGQCTVDAVACNCGNEGIVDTSCCNITATCKCVTGRGYGWKGINCSIPFIDIPLGSATSNSTPASFGTECLNGGVMVADPPYIPTASEADSSVFNISNVPFAHRVWCQCPDSYVGLRCEISLCPVGPNGRICSGHGTPKVDPATGVCSCQQAWTPTDPEKARLPSIYLAKPWTGTGVVMCIPAGGFTADEYPFRYRGRACQYDTAPFCSQRGTLRLNSNAPVDGWVTCDNVDEGKRGTELNLDARSLGDVSVTTVDGCDEMPLESGKFRCNCAHIKAAGRSGTFCDVQPCVNPNGATAILCTHQPSNMVWCVNGLCACPSEDVGSSSLPSKRIYHGNYCENDVTDACGFTALIQSPYDEPKPGLDVSSSSRYGIFKCYHPDLRHDGWTRGICAVDPKSPNGAYKCYCPTSDGRPPTKECYNKSCLYCNTANPPVTYSPTPQPTMTAPGPFPTSAPTNSPRPTPAPTYGNGEWGFVYSSSVPLGDTPPLFSFSLSTGSAVILTPTLSSSLPTDTFFYEVASTSPNALPTGFTLNATNGTLTCRPQYIWTGDVTIRVTRTTTATVVFSSALYTLSISIDADCVYGCGNGICNIHTAFANRSECTCNGVYVTTNATRPCSNYTCAGSAIPNKLGTACVCADSRMDPTTGCKTSLCPVHPYTGEICGRAVAGITISKQCIATGTGFSCSCSFPYTRNPTTGLCDSVCDYNYTAGAVTLQGSQSCICAANATHPRDPSTGCRDLYCAHGGFWTGSSCVCPAMFNSTFSCTLASGTYWHGLWFTGGAGATGKSARCQCPSCVHGGTLSCTPVSDDDIFCADGTVPTCACPSKAYGRFCESSLCNQELLGLVSADGSSCVCGDPLDTAHAYGGPFCNISKCTNGGTPTPSILNGVTRIHCDCGPNADPLKPFCDGNCLGRAVHSDTGTWLRSADSLTRTQDRASVSTRTLETGATRPRAARPEALASSPRTRRNPAGARAPASSRTGGADPTATSRRAARSACPTRPMVLPTRSTASAIRRSQPARNAPTKTSRRARLEGGAVCL